MRTLGIEVVARAVEVHRDQIDGVEAVLVAIRLALHQQHLLGEAVRSVGLFRIAIPEVFLAERHRRELGIRADGAHRQELGHAGLPSALDQLDAHDRVVIEESAGVLSVGAYPAHHSRKMDYQIWLAVGQRPVDVGEPAQVVVLDLWDEHLSGSGILQTGHNDRAQEACPARDHDPLALPEDAQGSISAVVGLGWSIMGVSIRSLLGSESASRADRSCPNSVGTISNRSPISGAQCAFP